MKKSIFVVLLSILFFATTAFAGQFGPAEPSAKEGKFSVGAGYFYSTGKCKSDDAGWSDGKLTSNQIYAQVGYGVAKNAEVYLRVGESDLKASPAFASGTGLTGFKNDFSDGFKPFATLGAKGLFKINSTFGIGPFVQATMMYQKFGDSTAGKVFGLGATQELELKNAKEYDIGIAFQEKVSNVVFYVGPVAYWTRADTEFKLTVPGVGSTTSSTTYKEKNDVGGFAGVRIPLGKDLVADIEGQYKSDWSAGASLTYLF